MTTLFLIKPDGMRRKLLLDVCQHLMSAGLRVEKFKVLVPTKEMAEDHYAEHRGRPYFDDLVTFTASGEVCAMILAQQEGFVQHFDVVAETRFALGATNSANAAEGTIRRDLLDNQQKHMRENIAHASDSAESAAREIKIWFP